jgi:hypothetical protein
MHNLFIHMLMIYDDEGYYYLHNSIKKLGKLSRHKCRAFIGTLVGWDVPKGYMDSKFEARLLKLFWGEETISYKFFIKYINDMVYKSKVKDFCMEILSANPPEKFIGNAIDMYLKDEIKFKDLKNLKLMNLKSISYYEAL